MNQPTPVSVIIASRHRSAALQRCLAGVRQLDHPCLEVIVVADPAGVAAVRGMGLADHVKLVVFDEANISGARNAGLAVAAGKVIAFIDDDAVPEPTWLSRLVAPFSNPDVTAAGGFVRGRNGLSYQWTACEVDALGHDHPLAVDPAAASLHRGTGARAVKTQGTNCAFRADALRAVGGFDPGFRFYLDEADLNLRLAARGGLTAVVPLAEVHHGFAPSLRRRADRVPTDLTEIGQSLALFLRKHGAQDPAAALADHAARQKARLIGHMVSGGLEPRDVGRLMDSLTAGMAEGMIRPIAPLPPLTEAGGFQPMPETGPRKGHVLAGRPWQRAVLRQRARKAVAAGAVVTIFRFSPTAMFHHLRFDAAGYWEQVGGLFGKSLRSDPLFRRWRFGARVAREAGLTGRLRPID